MNLNSSGCIFVTHLFAVKFVQLFKKNNSSFNLKTIRHAKLLQTRAVVVSQLVKRSLTTPEVCSSNPVIDKLLYTTFVYCQLYWKDENKEKVAIFKKKNFYKRGSISLRHFPHAYYGQDFMPNLTRRTSSITFMSEIK